MLKNMKTKNFNTNLINLLTFLILLNFLINTVYFITDIYINFNNELIFDQINILNDNYNKKILMDPVRGYHQIFNLNP